MYREIRLHVHIYIYTCLLRKYTVSIKKMSCAEYNFLNFNRTFLSIHLTFLTHPYLKYENQYLK